MINKNNHNSFSYIKNDNYHSIFNNSLRKQKIKIINTQMENNKHKQFLNHHHKIHFKIQKNKSTSDIQSKNSQQKAIINDLVSIDEFSRKHIDMSLQSLKNTLLLKNRYNAHLNNSIEELQCIKNNSVYRLAISHQLKNRININNSVQWFNQNNQMPIHNTHYHFFKKQQKINNLIHKSKQQGDIKQVQSDQYKNFKESLKQSIKKALIESKKSQKIQKNNKKQMNLTQFMMKNKVKQVVNKQDNYDQTVIFVHQNKLMKRKLKMKYMASKGKLTTKDNIESIKSIKSLKINESNNKKDTNDDISPWLQNPEQHQII